jgi:hypothetical protein
LGVEKVTVIEAGLVQGDNLSMNVRNRTHAYIGSRKRCGACSQTAQCTTSQYKYLAIHIHEPARQHAREGRKSDTGDPRFIECTST